jgi:hypothetical protein
MAHRIAVFRYVGERCSVFCPRETFSTLQENQYGSLLMSTRRLFVIDGIMSECVSKATTGYGSLNWMGKKQGCGVGWVAKEVQSKFDLAALDKGRSKRYDRPLIVTKTVFREYKQDDEKDWSPLRPM